MIIYLAGKPQNHELFAQCATYLRDMGPKFGQDLTVLSTWHDDTGIGETLSQWNRQVSDNRTRFANTFISLLETGSVSQLRDVQPTFALDMQLTRISERSQHEFDNADIVIADLAGGSFEAGYALAKGKLVITFGGDLNSPLLHGHPNLRSFPTWTDAVAHVLGPMGRFRHQRCLRKEVARTADTD